MDTCWSDEYHNHSIEFYSDLHSRSELNEKAETSELCVLNVFQLIWVNFDVLPYTVDLFKLMLIFFST